VAIVGSTLLSPPLPTSLWALYIFAGPHSDVGKGGDSSAQASSGSTQVCSPSSQVKAAADQVSRLKQNRRQGNLILSL
jgi:hypothetical protein